MYKNVMCLSSVSLDSVFCFANDRQGLDYKSCGLCFSGLMTLRPGKICSLFWVAGVSFQIFQSFPSENYIMRMICLCLRDVKELKLSTLYISLCTSTWQINDLRCLHCLVNSPMRSDDMKQTSGKQNSSSTQYHSASFQVDSTFFGNKSTLWLGRGGLMNESPENLTMKPSFAMALPFLVVLLDTQKS